MESIEKNIDKYIDYLKYEKKLSNNTISSYYENLKKFYSHFEKKNILNLNADEIRDFLYDEGIVARTRAHYLTVLKTFDENCRVNFRQLLREEIKDVCFVLYNC